MSERKNRIEFRETLFSGVVIRGKKFSDFFRDGRFFSNVENFPHFFKKKILEKFRYFLDSVEKI